MPRLFAAVGWLGLLGWFLGGGTVCWAQESQESGGVMEKALSSKQAVLLSELVDQMGILAYPLAALSLLAMFLILFYFLTIRQGTVVTNAFMNTADALIRKQDYLGLMAVCGRRGECVAKITEKTLDFATKNPSASFAEVREVTEAEGSRQASLLNQRITYLADIGAIAPMVGLLGTVIGMIISFNEIASESFAGAQQMGLAGGVSQALLTTAGGLIIGIPSLIFYSIFRGKVQRLISEMEAASTHLMALLAAQYKRATQMAQKSPSREEQGEIHSSTPSAAYSVPSMGHDPQGL